MEQDDGPVGQGTLVLLRRSEQPPCTLPPTPASDAPAPPDLGPARGSRGTPVDPAVGGLADARAAGPGQPESSGTLAGGIWIGRPTRWSPASR